MKNILKPILILAFFILGCTSEENKSATVIPEKLSEVIKSSSEFKDIFVSVDSIELKVDKTHLIGQIKSVKFFDNGNIVVCDDVGHNLLLFSKKGDFLRTIGGIGKGPGEFIRLSDIDVDADDNLLVLDNALCRVLKYNSNGDFLNSFTVKPFAYFILSQKTGNVLLYYAAAIPSPDFKMFVLYTHTGEQLKEFGERPQGSIIDGLPLVGGSFTKDSTGYIYTVHISEYKINKFDEHGNLITTFGRNAPFYRPISSPWLPYDTIQINSFTAVSKIFITSQGIVMVFLRKQKPAKQWLEIYDSNGNFLNGGIEIPEELNVPRCLNNDVLYFENSLSTIIDEKGNIPNPKLYGFKFKRN